MKIEHLVKDRVNGCPTGMKCDDCNLYIPLYSTNASGEVTAKYNCSWNNAVILASEMKGRVLGVQKATEDFRNKVLGVQAQIPSDQPERLLED